MRVTIKLLFCGSVLVLLSACATGRYPVEMQVENDEHEYSGTMTMGVGSKPVRLKAEEGAVQCEGVTMIGYAGPGCAQSGSIRLECSDERSIEGNWRFDEDCRGGRGVGRDDRGNAVTFLFGDAAAGETATGAGVGQSQASPATAEPASSGSEAAAPVLVDSQRYLFVVGGDYAAGFGGTSEYDIEFEDASSGLIIVRVDEDDPAPMVLAETPPTAGSEAFVVLPDDAVTTGRVVAVRLKSPAQGSELRLSGAVIPASGVPVVDATGEVVGLTVLRDEGARLYGSDRLRRYLSVLDTELADMPAEPSAALRLRRRIIPLRDD